MTGQWKFTKNNIRDIQHLQQSFYRFEDSGQSTEYEFYHK